MYAVILAGGGGTRLWPLSDPEHPKPFLPLFPDGSLLQKSVRRVTDGPELSLSDGDVTVVTDRRYESLVRDQLRDRPGISVLSEPMGRNTATAVALATLAIDRPLDDVMVILPADHLVEREGLFRAVLADARDELAVGAMDIESPIVTLGIQADWPATQYGYLIPKRSREKVGKLHSYVLDAFVEKPDTAMASDLLDLGGVAWNAGIFMARRRAMRDALERHTPLIRMLEGAVGSPRTLEAAYERVEAISIDYAVMQPAAAAGQVVMAGMDVGWSDIGTWTALLDALAGGYAGPARVVQPGEPIALGAEDLCVLRVDDDKHLSLEQGPLTGICDPYLPMALLPDASQHATVIESLVSRVAEWEAGLNAERVSA